MFQEADNDTAANAAAGLGNESEEKGRISPDAGKLYRSGPTASEDRLPNLQ